VLIFGLVFFFCFCMGGLEPFGHALIKGIKAALPKVSKSKQD
jgi:hypothetical protein